jgi:hypothetical protein
MAAMKEEVSFAQRAAILRLSTQQSLYPFPRLVAYIVLANASVFFYASHSVFPYFTLLDYIHAHALKCTAKALRQVALVCVVCIRKCWHIDLTVKQPAGTKIFQQKIKGSRVDFTSACTLVRTALFFEGYSKI